MSWLIELPVETQTALFGVVAGLLGLLIRWVSAKVPVWLGNILKSYEAAWAMTLGALVVGLVEANMPGGEVAGISMLAVQLFVAVAVYVLGKLGLEAAGLL